MPSIFSCPTSNFTKSSSQYFTLADIVLPISKLALIKLLGSLQVFIRVNSTIPVLPISMGINSISIFSLKYFLISDIFEALKFLIWTNPSTPLTSTLRPSSLNFVTTPCILSLLSKAREISLYVEVKELSVSILRQ